jgi:hypothetical protein
MQLDIYLPALKLAFEYQGEQHYQDRSMFNPLQRQKVRKKFYQVLKIIGT